MNKTRHLRRKTFFVMASTLILCASLLAIGINRGLAEEKRLQATADTIITDSLLTTWDGSERKAERYVNYGSNEGLSVIRGSMVGLGGFTSWRGILIRFDLSEIPPGAEVLEARLFLYNYSVWAQRISIYRLVRDWKELEATWMVPCEGCAEWWKGWQEWPSVEKNYVNQATDTQWVTEVDRWFSWDVSEDMRQFFGGTPNYGWFLKSAETAGTNRTSTHFYSRDTHREELRPYLLVKYRPAPRALTADITFPVDGTTVYGTPVEVRGMLSDPSASVNVNGIAASLSGNTFQAKVPLTEGSNTLTALAKDSYGQTASKSVTINLVTKGNVAGTVTDQSTNLPLALAGVSVTDSSNASHTVTTGEDGKYVITGVAFGPFTGSMAKEGYTPYSFSGTLNPGEPLTVDGTLSPILPVITNVAVSDVTPGSATITWTTDQPSDSLTQYGTTSSYGSFLSDPALVTDHRIGLANLSPNTTYHFRVTSTNAYGFLSSSGDNAFTTPLPSIPIALSITYPRDRDTISKEDTFVEGTVANAAGAETGVVVNGVLAAIYRNKFVANHVPLVEGANTITATATDVNGNTASASVGVNSGPFANYIRLVATTESGFSPLEVTLTLYSSLDLTSTRLVYAGPSQIEFLSATPSEYSVRISTEGTYLFTASVTDTGGVSYQDAVAITVLDQKAVEDLLTGRWKEMRGLLIAGNTEAALGYFVEVSRDRYRQVFDLLGASRVTSIFSNISDLVLHSLDERLAECGAIRAEAGGTFSYPVVYARDEKGLWKVVGF